MQRFLIHLSFLSACSHAFNCYNRDECYAFKQDAVCNEDCASEMCNFDSDEEFTEGDLFSPFKSSGCFDTCVVECDKPMLTNGVCDPECDIDVCGFDLGDCGYCASGCEIYTGFKDMLGDGICNVECSLQKCFYDWGDCANLSNADQKCTEELLSNKVCDEACNSRDYSYDNYYCPCSPGCIRSLLHNDVCDAQCNHAGCLYDFQSCEQTEGTSATCTYEMLINDSFDLICFSDKYLSDNFYHKVPECLASLYTNSVCDEECNRPRLQFDRSSCKPKDSCASECSSE
eukprot:CAMPEP_0204904450 /NCGR_PEP_ID=MMETSP1397-20131031/4873_1 /ASSEMBLY_ACC=CAM_ASM_000891 /TAXON_ID=49980 /ORGANISM="Climacostomum Climacostomum virens, Strain Stock W-24" /LENGTH=286 /DNA_ID=CAMNT_0052073245 /DNA_START=124 /DNA_END=981 /DNA_ORIENTATION=+